MPQTQPAADSFGDFATATLPALLRFGHMLTGDPGQAEDLVQEALARTLRQWRTVTPETAGAYVRRVMVNINVNRWRRWDSRVRVVGDLPEMPAEDRGLTRSDDWDQLRRALRELPVRQRTVLVLRYFEDMPEAGIAEVLDCRPGTVRSLACRGLAALRPMLAVQELAGAQAGAR